MRPSARCASRAKTRSTRRPRRSPMALATSRMELPVGDHALRHFGS
ncbi:hypothetical protein WP1_269 [Pseudomonas phage WP1]